MTAARVPRPVSLATVSVLLLGSGFCALVYQTVWFRAFRLVFGASTASTAAVLALFMAGIGIGSWWLGPKADRQRRPLELYAHLEIGIAFLAALSPLLVPVVYQIYGLLGGNTHLGMALGTVARLALAAPIIAIPAVLMGGTLPAAARAVEAGIGRRRTGWIYGCNTLGAVGGVWWGTFWALEHLGMLKTCLIAALANLLIAVVARRIARESSEITPEESSPGRTVIPISRIELPILAIAAATGFVFFLLEVVWYRILGPIIGGSTYTFGLILALALTGIGVGGLIFGARRSEPTPAALAGTLVLQGFAVVVPYAAGDHLALLAQSLRTFGASGFFESIVSWAMVTSLVVLPAAIVAGYQFPLLLAVLGKGADGVGRHVGLAYAWNTTGAIAGSLAGGFGLLPALGAPRLWVGSALLLVALGVALALQASWGRARIPPLTAGLVILSLWLSTAEGPTAFWRHSGIGAGRFDEDLGSPSLTRGAIRGNRRAIEWEVDGVESSVAVNRTNGYAFFVNGKSDGHAIGDASTQILSGLIGALSLDRPARTSLVIGLGTGSTAGWLGMLPAMERVDVVELEPAIVHVARLCSSVNADALNNPKVHIALGDAREVLMTAKDQYDFVFSEPSNPYRAGIASLFSAEFYRAVEQRLAPGGVLVQWLQGYEVDPEAVRVVYATLSEVFPNVETWHVSRQDLLLIAGRAPISRDLQQLDEQLRREPLASALAWTWGVEGVEGWFTGFVADDRLRQRVLASPAEINTDDRSVLEFGFARTLGRSGLFSPEQLYSLIPQLPHDPAIEGPGGLPLGLDSDRIAELRFARFLLEGDASPTLPPTTGTERDMRNQARLLYARSMLAEALQLWQSQSGPPMAIWDRLLLGEGLASRGDQAALEHIAFLERHRPTEAALFKARLALVREEQENALQLWLEAVQSLRQHPWLHRPIAVRQLLDIAYTLAGNDPAAGRTIFDALGIPFAASAFDESRLIARVRLAHTVDPDGGLCAQALAPFEDQPPWVRQILEVRVACYSRLEQPRLLARAQADLDRFLEDEPVTITGSVRSLVPSDIQTPAP